MKNRSQPNDNKRSLPTENAGSAPGENTEDFCKRFCTTIAKQKAVGDPCSSSGSPVNRLISAHNFSNNLVPLSRSHAVLGDVRTEIYPPILNSGMMNDIRNITAKLFNTQAQPQSLRTDIQQQMTPVQYYQRPEEPHLRSRADSLSATSSHAGRGSYFAICLSSSHWQNTHESVPSLATNQPEVPRHQEVQLPTDPRLRAQTAYSTRPCSSVGNSNQTFNPVFCTIRINEHESRDFASLDELQKVIGTLGHKGSVPPPDRFIKNGNKNLDQSIRQFDLKAVEFMLKNFEPIECFKEICRRNSLHIILKDTWESALVDGIDVSEVVEEAVMPVIRMAIQHLPEKILWKRDIGGNTLLHRAIQTKSKCIVKLLLDGGSPTYVRNNIGMSPVEVAIVMEQFDILDLLIRYGAKFHHILQENPTDRCDSHEFQIWLLKAPNAVKVAKRNLEMLDDVCKVFRSKLATSKFDAGPIVCIQRGISQISAFETTVEFVIPDTWSAIKEWDFVLMVVPTFYEESEAQYRGTSHSPFNLEPKICGQPCVPLFKREGSIYYFATDAIRNHFNHFGGNTEKLPPADGHKSHHPQVCSITLDFPARVNFGFMACQLVVTAKLENDMLPYRKKSNKYEKPKAPNASAHGYFRFYD